MLKFTGGVFEILNDNLIFYCLDKNNHETTLTEAHTIALNKQGLILLEDYTYFTRGCFCLAGDEYGVSRHTDIVCEPFVVKGLEKIWRLYKEDMRQLKKILTRYLQAHGYIDIRYLPSYNNCEFNLEQCMTFLNPILISKDRDWILDPRILKCKIHPNNHLSSMINVQIVENSKALAIVSCNENFEKINNFTLDSSYLITKPVTV